MVFSVLLRVQGPERRGMGMAYATENLPNHNNSASTWFFMCGFCRVVLLISALGGGGPGRKNEATHITEAMPIAIGNLAMWKVQFASCNVQWANRNYGLFPLGNFRRNPHLPNPMWNMQRLSEWGPWCSSPKSSQRFSPPNLACPTPTPKWPQILHFYGLGVGVYESVSFL